jgi:hypothetical protein
MERLPVASTKIDGTKTRSCVTIVSDPCTANTQMSRHLQFEILRMMADNPSLCVCGSVEFQTMKMAHDGSKWVVSLEAVHDTPVGQSF